jgi:hypothetical protein
VNELYNSVGNPEVISAQGVSDLIFCLDFIEGLANNYGSNLQEDGLVGGAVTQAGTRMQTSLFPKHIWTLL